MIGNITYEQLARLSIVEIWQRQGKDAIFLAYLRGQLHVGTAAKALGIETAVVEAEALQWLTELNSTRSEEGNLLTELAMWRSLVNQYSELVILAVEENQRLKARQRRHRLNLRGY